MPQDSFFLYYEFYHELKFMNSLEALSQFLFDSYWHLGYASLQLCRHIIQMVMHLHT